MLKLLRQAQQEQNPFLAGLRSLTDIDAHIATFEGRLGDLGKEGRTPLKVVDRFTMAGRLDEYRAAYALLALDAHNNSAALVDRHIDEVDGRCRVTLFAEPPASSMRARLDAITATLVQSALHVHRAFEFGHAGVEEIAREFDALRSVTIEGIRTQSTATELKQDN
jgi:hypothetical protein